MYEPFPPKVNIPEIEEEVLQFWEKNDIFSKSVESRSHEKEFVFYEGPPTANGRPGIHHVLARTMKDFGCRLKTMQGYRVERKAGWDTHGLPVEIEVEKQLKFTKKDQIIEYGVDRFNRLCQESVWKYKEAWDELTKRMGYWINLDDPYITYENSYIESVWWILKQFWERDLIYRGHKIVPYCPRCETPLSSHEVSLGYKDIDDPSVFVRMPLKSDPGTSFLVWTTTPWTLISNVALALHPEVPYVKVAHQGAKLILAEPLLHVLEGEYRILEKMKGEELAGIEYEPLFTFLKSDKRSHYTVLGEFVTTEDGTGIVHMAPAFGEDDYQAGLKNDLPFFQPIDKSGRFTAEIAPWEGVFFKKADPEIIKKLDSDGRLYKAAQYRHSYPHCWRDGTPLIYYAKESWYIKTTQYKDRFLALNKEIQWYPPEVGTGRFGEWLENNVDWALSRDRFWGTPLPIWLDEDGKGHCVGSIAELSELTGSDLRQLDLHRPHVDELTFKHPQTGKPARRTPEVIDVWFDSGAMPVAQWHYPFENKETFEQKFPADFISEAMDQTRGWFYSLLAISGILFDKPCYKSCVVLDMILDKDGQKMSKSKGNIVDPFKIMDEHGADPVRWYLMAVSPPWQTTRFDVKGIEEVVSRFFGTLTNTYAFFAMYANIDEFAYSGQPVAVAKRPQIDRWLISTLNALVAQIEKQYEVYDLTKGARAIADFVVNDLSNWYVRRCRRRFWKSGMEEDKRAAFETLFEAIVTVCKLMAPLAPFMSESIYRRMTAHQNEAEESVHLCRFPTSADSVFQYREPELESQMEAVRSVVIAGRSLRSAQSIKVRQPLRRIVVVASGKAEQESIMAGETLIKEELNVKSIDFVSSSEKLVTLQAEPNFRSLGPKLGKRANAAAEKIRQLGADQIKQLSESGRLELHVNGDPVELTLAEINITEKQSDGLAVNSDFGWTVALDTQLNDELIAEGLAREFVNRVQNMRKSANFEVVDRIHVRFEGSPEIHSAIDRLKDYIKNETLAETLESVKSPDQHLSYSEEWKLAGKLVVISLDRVQ